MLKNKDLTPELYAKYLVENFGEVLEEELPAQRHIEEVVYCAKLCLKQMYEFGSLNGLHEPLMFLNATEKELNKILKQL